VRLHSLSSSEALSPDVTGVIIGVWLARLSSGYPAQLNPPIRSRVTEDQLIDVDVDRAQRASTGVVGSRSLILHCVHSISHVSCVRFLYLKNHELPLWGHGPLALSDNSLARLVMEMTTRAPSFNTITSGCASGID
jgi:hypothetical protein